MSNKGIGLDVSKIEGITQFPIPLIVKDIKDLLGLASYNGRFISDFVSVSSPLTDLISSYNKATNLNKCKIHWTNKCQTAFEILKNALVHDDA